MWTASIVGKEQGVSNTLITVQYTDGVKSFTEVLSTDGNFSTVDQFKYKVAKRIDMLNGEDSINTTLASGLIELPEKVEEIDVEKTQFMTDYNLFVQFKRAIELGIIEGDNPDYLALLEKIKKTFKYSYFSTLY